MSLLCDNGSAATRRWNSEWPLTHSSDPSREGLAMKATRTCAACSAEMAKRPNDSWSQWEARRFCSRECAHRSRVATPAAERLWRRVDTSDPDACWLWPGATTPGGKYGVIGKAGGKAAGNILTHVVAYLDQVGSIPDGYQIDHLCRVTLCCNPAHLEAVTQAENLRRQQMAITHCLYGHDLTPENVYNPPGTPGKRQCRKCIKRRTREATERRRDMSRVTSELKALTNPRKAQP